MSLQARPSTRQTRMFCFGRVSVASSPTMSSPADQLNGSDVGSSRLHATATAAISTGVITATAERHRRRDGDTPARHSSTVAERPSLWSIVSRSTRAWMRRCLKAVTSRHRPSVVLGDVIRSSSVLAAAALVPDARLPVIPLNEREMFALMRSWKIIQKDIVETGIDMFLKMFERNRVVRTVFEKFRELEDGLSDSHSSSTAPTAPVAHHGYVRQSIGGGGRAMLARSTVLRIHGLVVMNAIDEIISSLDETNEVIELILEQGRSHARFGDSLTEEIFWAIEEPFLLAVKSTLGDKNNPFLNELYRKTIHFILTTLVIGFHQVVKKSDNDNDNFLRRHRSHSTNTSADPGVDDQRQRSTDDVDEPRTLRTSPSRRARTKTTESPNRSDLIRLSPESGRHQSPVTEKDAGCATKTKQESGVRPIRLIHVTGSTASDDVRAKTGRTPQASLFEAPAMQPIDYNDETVPLPGQATLF